jgi:Polyketide cyclase / dehydrase and lipid transport
MATNEYHFITHWRVQASIQEVSSILGDAKDLQRWWPSVYLNVKVLEPGDASGVGRVVELLTKGFLPYTLRWKFRVTESDAPHGFALEAFGDFVGHGVWTFIQDGDFCEILYDWRIEAEKPILKHLSFLMKPIFSANHHWAMRKGLESLQLELQRRRAVTLRELDLIPEPPAPTWPHRKVKTAFTSSRTV